MYLSGGGSFFPFEGNQEIKILARYVHSELECLGKQKEECKERENAAVLAKRGRGAVVLVMFHPESSAEDIDVEVCKRAFPNSGTDWQAVHDLLQSSSLDQRVQFIWESILQPLEDSIQ